jgi:hypothetical protein
MYQSSVLITKRKIWKKQLIHGTFKNYNGTKGSLI